MPGLQPAEGAALLRTLGILGTEAQLQAFAKKAEGHPLLLKLVAGFLKVQEESDPQISHLQKYGLADVPQLLTDEKLRGIQQDKIEQWMLQVLEASFNCLSEKLQRLFLNLSVYRLPFNSAAAVAQLPIPPDERGESDTTRIEQDLRQLCRCFLLQEETNENGGCWFQFHPFVLEYARQKAEDLTEAHQRAIDYYRLNLKECPWQTKDDVAEYLEIFYHYCELKQYAPAFDILHLCDDFLKLQDYNTIRVELYEQLVRDWKASDDEESKRSAAHRALRKAYIDLKQHQRAIEYYQQLLEICQEINDHLGEASSLIGLGNAYNSLKQYEQAIEYYQQSLEICREINERSEEAICLNNLGIAYDSLKQYERAIEYYQQSLETFREINDRSGEASSLNNLGNKYYSLGQYERAIEYYQQSLEIKREIGDRSGEASSLYNLGNAYDSLGQYQRAIEYYQQFLKIKREIGNRSGEASSLYNLGNKYYCLKQYERAIEYYQQSLEIKREIGDRSGEASSLYNLGNAYDSLKQYERAIEYYQQSLEICREIGNRSGEANSLRGLGNTYYCLGQYQRAIEYYQQSLEIKRERGDRIMKIGCLLQHAPPATSPDW
jgi:tetratricopeptide (TPR) repeat protein